MSYSIVFNIDQQLDVQEKTSELDAIATVFDENAPLNLAQIFTPDHAQELQNVIQSRSVNTALVQGSLVALDQQPAARLFVHCV